MKLLRFAEHVLTHAKELVAELREPDDDQPKLLSEIKREVGTTRVQFNQLAAELQQRLMVPRDKGNVLLLWQSEQGPRCISRTVRFSGKDMIEVEFDYSGGTPLMPAGTWVVGIGCDLRAVNVGPYTTDLGPAARAAVAITDRALEPGWRLLVAVQPEK